MEYSAQFHIGVKNKIVLVALRFKAILFILIFIRKLSLFSIASRSVKYRDVFTLEDCGFRLNTITLLVKIKSSESKTALSIPPEAREI